MNTITLVSSDGVKYETDIEVAKCSGTIKSLLENLDLCDGKDVCLPLPSVKGSILKLILEWAQYHKDSANSDVENASKEKNADNISDWDKTFLAVVPDSTLFELITAANALNIKELMDIACDTVVNKVKGKTPDEIRKVFNLENDFSDDEKEQMLKENDWIE